MAKQMNHALANKVMDAVEDNLNYLYDRWQDEKEYEDIKDYGKVIAKALKKVRGATFLEMTKRPFGFKWRGDDGHVRHTQATRTGIRTLRKPVSGPSLHQKYGADAPRVLSGMMLDQAEKLPLPDRFQIKAGTAPNNVNIFDNQTRKVLNVGLCELHGAIKALSAFCK